MNEKYFPTLKEYLEGKISLAKLSEIVDERLVELRQTPAKTEEGDFLSSIELIIHEIGDGFRAIPELKEYINGILTPSLYRFSMTDIANKNLTECSITSAENDDINIKAPNFGPVMDYQFVITVG